MQTALMKIYFRVSDKSVPILKISTWKYKVLKH